MGDLSYKDGMDDERKRWHTALTSMGIRSHNRSPYDCAQVLRWRIETAEEMAIDIARNTIKECSKEGVVDLQGVLEALNTLWTIYQNRMEEEDDE